MSSPAPVTTTTTTSAPASTAATTPSTTPAAASTSTTTSTAPSAPTTKKPASLKAVTGFGKLDPNALANMAHHIAQGIGGNPVYFPNPPIDPAALDASANTLAEAVLAAMDGGKTAKALVKKQHKLIVQDLNLLAVYEGLPIFRTEKRTPKGGLQPLCLVLFFGSSSIVVKESPELG